jgi:hypothetical protein
MQGVVFVQSVADFASNLEKHASLLLPPVNEWPKITDCVCRGTLFSLTATTPHFAYHSSLILRILALEAMRSNRQAAIAPKVVPFLRS